MTGDVWRDRALCTRFDPEDWFRHITPGRTPDRRRALATADAKAVCAECAVRTECLEYALERPERHGVWGGLDEFERRNLQRRRVVRS